MGWLNTLLDVAVLGVDVANASKLEQLRRQGAATALVDAVLKALRQELFEIRQAADEVLNRQVETAPKTSAAALRLLERRLADSGITPELFAELGDKEYCAATLRLVRDNARRHYEQLAPDHQAEVNRVVEAAHRLKDYSEYAAHHSEGQALMKALPVYQELAGRNSTALGLFASLGVCMGLYVLPFGCAAMASGMGLEAGTGGLAGFVLFVGLVIIFVRWRRSGEFQTAKKIVQPAEGKFDIERFAALDREFGGSRAKAEALRQEAERLIAAFFGEAPIPTASAAALPPR